MIASSTIQRGRAAAAGIMVDTGRITRAGGPPVLDPDTGIITDPNRIVVYIGVCRVRQPNGLVEAQALFGDEQITTQRFIACFPHDAVDAHVNDVVTVTASADLDMVGRDLRVLSIPMGTYMLYKGYPVESVE